MMSPADSSAEFNPELFVDVAKRLAKLDLDREARTRSAVGRAYYSLYLATRRALYLAAQRPPRAKVKHGDIPAALYSAARALGANPLAGKMSSLAMLLGEAYDAREQADYNLSPAAKWQAKLRTPRFATRLADQAIDVIRRLKKMDLSAAEPYLP